MAAKKTKIIATVGPASMSRRVLEGMRDAGMDAVRINTAHGGFEQYAKIISEVRRLEGVPVMLDIKGPEIRVNVSEPVQVRQGELIEAGFSGRSRIRFSHDFSREVKRGDTLLIDNGKLSFTVKGATRGKVLLSARNSGAILPHKGVNIPGRPLKVPSLSAKDLEAIEFAKKHGVEFIALSFTRSREDVLELKRRIGGSEIGVIAKIENPQGVKNIDGIISESDGVMVARGDLGVEVGTEKVPLMQKSIIRKANEEGKIAVTATQMLESMIEQPFPTRAETSDVANAVLDGSDAVMLSGETAAGKYPVESVKEMAAIAREVEGSVPCNVKTGRARNISSVVSEGIFHASGEMKLDKIVTITRSGYTARMIARYRQRAPIIAVTFSKSVLNQLALVFGVTPYFMQDKPRHALIATTAQFLYRKRAISKTDMVLFTAGILTRRKHASNLIEIHEASDLLNAKLGHVYPEDEKE
ncbi:Pyruvate kinase [uncultured archaeon]|nr:Pyruvate kinase [uncultured archaeon]